MLFVRCGRASVGEGGEMRMKEVQLQKKEAITEVRYENNFGYILEDESFFRSTDYKVLQSQAGDIFIRCMKILCNGKIELFYLTKNYCPLSGMLENIAEETLIRITAGLLDDIVEVESNGFLSGENVELSWDRIYVDAGTLKVRLVYVPVTFRLHGSRTEFEERLRSDLIRLLNDHGNLSEKTDGRILSLMEDLSDSSLTLKDLRKRIIGMEKKESTDFMRGAARKMPEVSPLSVAPGEKRYPLRGSAVRLVCLNGPKNFEIPIDKASVVIGKKKETADAAVPFSRLISRRHCVIARKKDEYYITDMGSTNGTFLNRMRLVRGREYRLSRGDIVRLADIDFRVI